MNTMTLHDRARTGARRRARLAAGVAAGTAGLALALGPAALAALAPVTPVGCSAADLVAAVSGATSGAVLALAPSCTYVLSERLNIPVSLTIKGNGDTITAGTPGFTLLSTNLGAPVSLDGLTLSNADPGTDIDGGAIANFGTLTITGSTFTDNTAGSGGAIENDGTLTVTGSTFTGNSTGFGGNGAAIDNLGTLTITGSTFTGNTGGAISSGGRAAQQASLTVTGSTFSGNDNNNNSDGGAISITSTPGTLKGDVFTHNTALSGGAIYDFCNGAEQCALRITGNTFSGNAASYDGGAIMNGAPLTMASSTLSGNVATGQDSGPGGGYGGGIYNFGTDPDNVGTAALTNTVITGNTAGVDGGGIADQFAGLTTLTRTQVQSNTPDNCAPTGTIAGCTD